MGRKLRKLRKLRKQRKSSGVSNNQRSLQSVGMEEVLMEIRVLCSMMYWCFALITLEIVVVAVIDYFLLRSLLSEIKKLQIILSLS